MNEFYFRGLDLTHRNNGKTGFPRFGIEKYVIVSQGKQIHTKTKESIDADFQKQSQYCIVALVFVVVCRYTSSFLI